MNLPIAALATQLLRALAAYWEVRAVTAIYDREDELSERLRAQVEEIERLRDAGDTGSTDRADQLRIMAKATRRQLEHLRACRHQVAGGEADTDG